MSFIIKNCVSLFKLAYAYITNSSYPFICVLRLTDHCSLKCHYCDTTNFCDEIPIDELLVFLDNVYKKGCRTFTLTGGEPFMYSHLDKLTEWFKDKKIYLTINTNGQSIDEQKYKDFLMIADEVLVSIDGPEDTNNYFRGQGTYSLAIKTMEFLKDNNINIITSTVLTKTNCNINTFKFLSKISKTFNSKVGLNPVTSRGRINSTDFSIQNSVELSQINDLQSYIKDNPKGFEMISKSLINYWISPVPLRCKTIFFAYFIDVNSKIFPCINVTDIANNSLGPIKAYNKAQSALVMPDITCEVCSCIPLIQANIMFQNRFPSLKVALDILARY